MSEDGNKDDLLDRAKKLRDKVSSTESVFSDQSSGGFSGFITKSKWFKNSAALLVIAKSYLGPFGTLLGWIGSLIAKWFNWAAFPKMGGSTADKATISAKRFFITLPATILVLLAIHMTVSAIYYYSTQFTETVYVTGKQEIDTGELYQFGGCISLPCSTESESGKFYLIEASPYFPILFYPEEDVFANIPQQNGACEIKGYGIYFRRLRWIYKSFQLYQHVTDVSCRPFNADEIRRSSNFSEKTSTPK